MTFRIDEHQDDSVKFSEEEEEEEGSKLGSKKVLLTCVGSGFTNFSKGQV